VFNTFGLTMCVAISGCTLKCLADIYAGHEIHLAENNSSLGANHNAGLVREIAPFECLERPLTTSAATRKWTRTPSALPFRCMFSERWEDRQFDCWNEIFRQFKPSRAQCIRFWDSDRLGPHGKCRNANISFYALNCSASGFQLFKWVASPTHAAALPNCHKLVRTPCVFGQESFGGDG